MGRRNLDSPSPSYEPHSPLWRVVLFSGFMTQQPLSEDDPLLTGAVYFTLTLPSWLIALTCSRLSLFATSYFRYTRDMPIMTMMARLGTSGVTLRVTVKTLKKSNFSGSSSTPYSEHGSNNMFACESMFCCSYSTSSYHFFLWQWQCINAFSLLFAFSHFVQSFTLAFKFSTFFLSSQLARCLWDTRYMRVVATQ